MSKPKKLVIVTLLILLIQGVIVVATLPDSKPTKTSDPNKSSEITYKRDLSLASMMRDLGLDYSKLNLIVGKDPRNGGTNSLGSFSPPNTIYVTSIGERTNVTLSHEYLHYIQTLYPEETSSFHGYVNFLMQSDPALQRRMTSYLNGSACGGSCHVENETEAVACTEISNSSLSKEFIAFCNHWLPSREQTLTLR